MSQASIPGIRVRVPDDPRRRASCRGRAQSELLDEHDRLARLREMVRGGRAHRALADDPVLRTDKASLTPEGLSSATASPP
jgi:hypothetical protein